MLLHGDVIDRYRILAHIADGGMAAVYLAERDGPGTFRKQVALKVIHRHLMNDRSFVQMFADEAQIAARLHHPNIVQTFDLVQTRYHLAIAMEYAPGLPAAALLPGERQALGIEVSSELVAYVGAEVAAGLEHAHTLADAAGDPLNVVHRDISPSNIHIGFDGRIRIVDFGVARARGRLSSTSTGTLKGTLPYVAPEQLARGEPSPRSDIWSLGVVLWELCAGRRLFRRETEAETAHAVVTAEIAPLGSVRPGFPTALGAAIGKALERDPARRWESAAQMERLLREALPTRIGSVREPLVAALGPHRARHVAELQAILDPPDEPSISAEVGPPAETSTSFGDDVRSKSGPGGWGVGEGRRHTDRDDDETPTPMAVPDIPRVRHTRRTGWLAFVGIATGGLVFLMAHDAGDRSPSPVLRPRAATTRAAPAGASSVPRRVSVEITSAVPDAGAFLDGARLGPLPVRTLVESDRRDHVLRVEAPGHRPEIRTLSLGTPVQLRVDPEPLEDPDDRIASSPREPRTPPAVRRSKLRGLMFHEDPYR